MIAATKEAPEAGIRKAAILVASLDQEASDLLLDQLDPRSADLVRQATMDVDIIDVAERQRVIDEFRRIGPMIPDKCPPGIELDCITIRSAAAQMHLAKNVGETAGRGLILDVACNANNCVPESSNPFGFLDATEEETLAELLGGESPQTIALVMSYLPPERACGVLPRLSPSLQAEAMRRLVDLEDSDPETMRDVGQALELRLTRQFAAERGSETAAKILAACESRAARRILENLAEQDESLAERLGRRPLGFDELGGLDNAALLAVIRAADPEVVEAALFGAAPQLVERIIGGMSADEAKILLRKLNNPGPIRLSDVEESRRQIAALAQRMSCSG
jgi:flagellar motor switch protein FliG